MEAIQSVQPKLIGVNQRGALLIMSLFFLLLITLIGMNAANMSIFNQKMSGAQKDISFAKENAEQALLEGEGRIVSWDSRPTSIDSLSGELWSYPLTNYGLTQISDPISGESLEWYQQLEDWWRLHATETQQINGEAGFQPHYVIEELEVQMAGGDLSQPGFYYAQPGIVYYRVTARARGDNAARVTLQSIFARTYD